MYSKGKLVILFVSALFVAYAAVGGIWGTAEDAGVKTLKELRIFSDVLSKVQSDYVDAPDISKTLSGALQGLMDALDPQSSYVAAKAVPAMRERNSRFKADIGVVLAKRYGYGYVVSVLSGSPADAAGLRNGDLLETIEGRQTTELGVAEMESLLRGAEGSDVALNVVRARNSEPMKISVARRIVEAPAVQAKVLETDIGYMKIFDLSAGVAAEVSAKLRMLSGGKFSGLVVDLRGTASGDYDEAMKVADLFLPAGKTMGSLKDRKEKIRDYTSTDDPGDAAVPLVILTTVGTAGPAESLAAALKENERAEVIGEKTSGVASLQQEMELEGGALLILTTRLFYSPTGAAIQNENARKAGVQPSIKVPDDSFVTSFYYQNPNLSAEEQYNRLIQEVDKLQLQKALEYLKAPLKKAA